MITNFCFCGRCWENLSISQSFILQKTTCRGGPQSTWTWWLRSTARRSRTRNHRFASHAHKLRFLRQEQKTRNVFLHQFFVLFQSKRHRKRWKFLLQFFFVSKESANCVKKAVSVNERKYVSIIISTQKFQKKIEYDVSGWNYPGMLGFLVKLWYIRCGLSALSEENHNWGQFLKPFAQCLCFIKYYLLLAFSLRRQKTENETPHLSSKKLILHSRTKQSNKKPSKQKGHTVPNKVV